MAVSAGRVFQSIQRKLTEALKPASLVIKNESHLHAGHSGNPSGAKDAETHFRVEVISDAFSGKPTVARHRAVYKLLEDEIAGGVHALSLRTLAPGEK